MQQHFTPTTHDEARHAVNWNSRRPQCQVCGERDGQGIVAGLLVCGVCYSEAKDETIRLWRASLRLIQDGWPR